MSQTTQFPLLTLDEVDAVTDPGWLVHEVVPARTLVQIFGKPESGKSFIALDMALKVAVGMPWMGDRTTTPGKVVYVAGEGLVGLRKRILAWKRHYARSNRDITTFWVVPMPVQLAEEPDIRGIVESIVSVTGDAHADLIVFDTQSRCTAGVDENSAQEMGAVVAALDYIREQTGATLVLVHHTPHNEDRGRGSTVIPGAVDTIIGVKMPKKGRIVLSCHKQKDWEEFEEIKLVLQEVPGTDFPVPLELSGEAGLSDSERKVLDAIRRAPQQTVLVSDGKWDELELSRATYYRCVTKLKKLNMLADVGNGSVRAVSPQPHAKTPSISPSHTPLGVRREKRDGETGAVGQNVRLKLEH